MNDYEGLVGYMRVVVVLVVGVDASVGADGVNAACRTRLVVVLEEALVDVLARFPVLGQHVAVGTRTKGGAQRVEAVVRAAEVVAETALVQVFAAVPVGGQLRPRTLVAAALVAAVRVAARALAWSVPVA